VARAFIGVGSNIEPERNVRQALRLLAELERVVAVSTVYRTQPLGRPEQEPYYNCVVEIDTRTLPLQLKLGVLRPIEAELGRVRGADKWAARTIDLDLLAYDELELHNDDLTLPDPDIATRPFLALALRELAPGLELPGLGSVARLAEALSSQGMEALADYTELLRGDIAHESAQSRATGP
jgi:2-amino-4-hydroxy-6-hydroxymethyldihydropteridine diphosphokinase